MGLTIRYRGSITELSRVEDFEDRVIDLALAVGGNPRLWRSADDNDRSRMVRGLMIDLAPGQETTSLLISPEGWFISVFQIEDAEKGLITEPPWCWVKTQFGPIEGHVALVELLAAIKKEFAPDLEVMDEGGYWESRDVAKLRQKIEFLGRAIDMLAGELDKDRLSPEAREDPEILATRIERLARKVQQTLARPAEHPPVHFPDDETGVPPSAAENEALWDELFAENRRKQERMERVIEEERLRGTDTRAAFEAAIREVVPECEFPEEVEGESDVTDDELIAELNEASQAEVDEPWQESLPEAARSDAEDDNEFERMERHPLQQRAKALLMEFFAVAKRSGDRSANLDTLIRNGMETTGGLAQALTLPAVYEMDDSEAGLALVQLKRALHGAAFVRGTLFLLRSEEVVSDEEFKRFMDEADAISSEITELLRAIREGQA